MADGSTYQEALANAEVIIGEWLETAKNLGRQIPEPKGRWVFARFMSVLSSIRNLLGIKMTAAEFYRNCKVEKIEWWLSWCHEYPDLFWARLRKFSNGKADVLFQGENKSWGFENEDFAGNYISEDEFSKIENIDEEDRNDLRIPADVLIKTPDWGNKEVKNFEYIGKY